MHAIFHKARQGLLGISASVLLLVASTASGTADGPDFYSVTGVGDGDVLNIRAAPQPSAETVGEIPHRGTCIRNLGCRGGLTYREFTSLTEAHKAARLKANPRWCKVEYRGVEGWVAGRYLREGACDAQAVDPAPVLSDLVGVRGRDGEAKLAQLGYRFQGGRKEAGRSLTFYKEPRSGRCLQVVTRDGRYESLKYVEDAQCRSAAKARVVTGRETSLSSELGAASFRTVCGVIVGNNIYRYLCEVTDLKETDDGMARTALRFPDNELQLLWGEGDQVCVQFEGLAALISATYSVQEGETDILVEDKTYFYWSDRGLAAMEVEHFKP